jgi:hypothetical protein
VILVLTSYDSTEFELSIARNTNVVRVLTSGYHHNTIVGLPTGVEAESVILGEGFFYDDREQKFLATVEGRRLVCTGNAEPYRSSFQIGLDLLRDEFQLVPHSIQGAAEAGEFSINGETRGIRVSNRRENHRCYRDPDGVVRMYEGH